MTSARDTSQFRAQLLDPRDPADQAALARLQSAPEISVIDELPSQLAELRAVRPAPDRQVVDEAPRWAYYPWRRTVVSVLGPTAFRQLRLDRNRNKLTREEQQRLATLTIGVVGLSVGHAIAHTMALEGLCGGLRLADFDLIELSNLNRIPATVLDVGLNKAVVAARHIAELDPYLPLSVLVDGLTDQTMDGFLDGLDLVVEECDSLDVKMSLREAARERGIPVLMETSDRGLFDVERFDDEPGRAVLHGLLGNLRADELRGLSTHDKVPHVLRIIDIPAASTRMVASMVEIDHSVTTWPQLGGDVMLGAATVAAAVRRLGRGDILRSGRIRIDLDEHLDRLADPPVPDALPEPALTRPARHPLASDRQAVLDAVALAPSGGNVQPWSATADQRELRIYLAPDRTTGMDVHYRGSYVAIGAALYNARVAAASRSVLGPIETSAAGPHSDLVATMLFGSAPDARLAGQYDAMTRRRTNRRLGTPQPLRAHVQDALRQAAEHEGAAIHFVTDRTALARCADLIAASDRVRYLTPRLHEEMMSELRWPGQDRLDIGIDVRTLELDSTDLAKLLVAGRADVMAQLARWDGGQALGDSTRDRVNSSSALAVVTVAGRTPADYIGGGSATESVWICAEQHGLAVHPVSPVFLYAASRDDLTELSAPFADELLALQDDFRLTAGLASDESPVLVLRLSHAPPPSAVSGRLPAAVASTTIEDPPAAPKLRRVS